MSLLSKTLGRFIPRYRTFSDWVTVYRQIIDARPIQPKTLQNRNASLRRLIDEFGPRTISARGGFDFRRPARFGLPTRPQLGHSADDDRPGLGSLA